MVNSKLMLILELINKLFAILVKTNNFFYKSMKMQIIQYS